MASPAFKSPEEFLAAISALGSGAAPTATQDPYALAKAEFGTSTSGLGLSAGVGAGVKAPELGGRGVVAQSATGKILFQNGVIADPASGTFLAPMNDPSVVGSQSWLVSIQDAWSKEKVNEWRKKLAGDGYDVAPSGGWAVDLVNALGQYHENRYLNFGKPLPQFPTGKGGAKQTIRDAIDPIALREEVKAWGQVPFDDDLAPEEADYFADRIVEVATRLAKEKGWSAEQAISGAQTRVQKEFVEQEPVASGIKDLEEDEMDETFRDQIVSISQLASI